MRQNVEALTIPIGDGVQVIVPIRSVAAALLSQHLMPAQPNGIPRIGQPWPGQGGIYAGVMRGRNSEPDYHLIVGGNIQETTWDKAKAAAEVMEADGHRDFTLPFRAEQALQFANVPELFEKEWYWSCEQHAENAGSAWRQGFGYGSQHYSHEGNEFRARAVRRLIIR